MDNKKLKRYKVTQTVRFQSKGTKVLFFGGLVLGSLALIAIAVCIIIGTTDFLGLAVIVAILSAIWVFATRLISESAFGLSNVSFSPDAFIFYQSPVQDAKSFSLYWDDVKEVGIEKTRWSYWVYASDHRLEDAEKVEFPEHVKDGVFYFSYAYNTWEAFMEFVPEQYKAYLEAEKAVKKIK